MGSSTTGRIYSLLSSALSMVILLFIVSCAKGTEEKKYVVGIINPNTALIDVVRGFKTGMATHGYIEGQNITYLSGRGDIASTLQVFKDKEIDVVFTISTPVSKKAKEELRGTNIPVVGLSYDPVKGGIVKSLTYKRDNITGIQVGGSVEKAFEWMMMSAPEIKRLFVPVKFDTPATRISLDDLKEAAMKFDIDLLVSEAETLTELKNVLAAIPEDIDAVFVLHSIFIVSNLDLVLESAVKHGLPTASGSGLYKNGVTISYGQDHTKTGERASGLAHRILQGLPAFSIPFETADFYLGINLISAKAAGFHVPDYILRQANNIIRPSDAPGRTGKAKKE